MNANVLFLLCSLMPSRTQREVTNHLHFPLWCLMRLAKLICFLHAVLPSLQPSLSLKGILFCLTFYHCYCASHLKQSMDLHLGDTLLRLTLFGEGAARVRKDNRKLAALTNG